MVWGCTWTTVDAHQARPGVSQRMVVHAVVMVVGAAVGDGGSLGGLPCRCHVPQCAPTPNEGQDEGKGGDSRTPLITHASSNKHHPVSHAKTKAPKSPPTFPLWLQKCNHLPPPQDASRSASAVPSLTAHAAPTAVVRSSCSLRVRTRTGRGTQKWGAGKRSADIREAGAMQTHSKAEHIKVQAQPVHIKQQ